MRKIFLIALFALCAIEGFSQRYTPFQGWGFSARRLKADSVSIVPSDTVINKAANSVAIFNGRVYFQNGTRWQDISYDLPINVRDSISALYPLLYNSSTGVLSADTGRNAASIATGGVVNKVKDSLAASIVLRLLISDTASMLSPYLRKVDTASISNRIDLKLNISDTASMLLSYRNTLNTVQVNKLNISDTASMLNNYRNTLNTVQVNKLNLSDSSLYASRGRLYKVADSLGSVIASVSADSLVFSTKAYRQKGVDSVQANLAAGLALKLNISDTSSMLSPYYRTALANATIVQRITDSLRALVRLRASGSGGIDLQNSNGTSVATFGSAGTTNGSIAGGWNVGGNSTISGTLGVTQKATFTDSIVGNIIRSRNTSGVSIQNNSGTTIASFGSSGGSTTTLAELSVTSGVSAQTGTFSNVLTVSGASNYLSLNNIGYVRADATGNTLDLQVGTGGLRIMNNGYGSSLFNITNAGAATFTGALTANGKATFTDSIVGVNQRLSGNIQAATFNGSALGSYAFRSSGLAELSGATFTGELSTNGNLIANTPNNASVIILGGSPTNNWEGDIRFITSNSVTNWRLSSNRATAGAFTITPSTTAGGSTFTTPVLTISSTGATTLSGALTATAQGNNIAQSVDSAITGTSYTLALTDAGYFKRVTNSSAVTITIPENSSVAFPVGTYIILQQQGTGQITISPASSNVSFESPDGALKSRVRYSKLTLLKVNTNRWDIGGDLTN